MDWDDVLRLGAEPPGIEAGRADKTPSLHVGCTFLGRLLDDAWLERAPKRVVARLLGESDCDAGT